MLVFQNEQETNEKALFNWRWEECETFPIILKICWNIVAHWTTNIFIEVIYNRSKEIDVCSSFLNTVDTDWQLTLIQVILDTGSANLWVPDKTCSGGTWDILFCEDFCNFINYSVWKQVQKWSNFSGNPCAKKSKFDSTKSSTYAANGKQFLTAIAWGIAVYSFRTLSLSRHPAGPESLRHEETVTSIAHSSDDQIGEKSHNRLISLRPK